MEITDTETVDRSGPATTLLTGFVPGPDRGGSRRWRAALRTTPARIILYGAVLVLLLVATAVVALGSDPRARMVGRESVRKAAQASTDAEWIYTKLAATDRAASELFLREELSPHVLKKYQLLVDEIVQKLNALLAEAIENSGQTAPILTVVHRFDAYRRIVTDALEAWGTATPAERLLASAYAREASYYMSGELLAAAGRLWNDNTGALRKLDSGSMGWAVASVGMPLVLLAALAVVQRWLWRRTRRRLNPGLLLATLSCLAVLGLAVASWLHGWQVWKVDISAVEVRSEFDTLADDIESQEKPQQALKIVLACHAKVYLALGNSTEPERYRKDFEKGGPCASDPEIDPSKIGLVWTARQQNDPDSPKTYEKVVTDVSAGEIAEVFNRRVSDLEKKLADGQKNIDKRVNNLESAPEQRGGIAAGLVLLAGAGVVLGLRQRLVEYR